MCVGPDMNVHLVIEDLRLATLGRRNEVLVQNLENVFADLRQFGLDLLAVLLDQGHLLLVALRLLLLLDAGHDAPGSTTSADDVLVGDGKQISLLNGQFLVGGGNSLHVLDHFWRSVSECGIDCRGTGDSPS